MKLVWSGEAASKAYFDTVKACDLSYKETTVAEFISAMAAGFNAKLIVETWIKGGAIKTSLGLAIASYHSGGRHVCIVPDEESKMEYIQELSGKAPKLPEMLVAGGKPEEVMGDLEGIEFMVVDSRGNDFESVFKVAKLGEKGAVLMCKNASDIVKTDSGFRWENVLDRDARIVRVGYMPVGNGLDTVHVGARSNNPAAGSKKTGARRWIRRIDRDTGEEIIIRTI